MRNVKIHRKTTAQDVLFRMSECKSKQNETCSKSFMEAVRGLDIRACKEIENRYVNLQKARLLFHRYRIFTWGRRGRDVVACIQELCIQRDCH